MSAEIALLAVSLGLNIFGAAQEGADAERIIQHQYEANMDNYEFQKTQRENLYNYEKDVVKAAAEENAARERNYRMGVDLQNWQIENDRRLDDYDAKLAARTQSLDDYEEQERLNDLSRELALRQTQQKYNDQETALGFQNREELQKQLGQYNQLITQLSEGQNIVDDALMQETIRETQALRDRDQQLDEANYNLDMIREQAAEQQTTTDLQNVLLQERVNTARTGRDEQLMLLEQGKETDELATDNAIYRNQLETTQQVALEGLKLDQTTASLEGSFSDKKLASDQLVERLKIKKEGDDLDIDQKVAQLDDEQKYYIFSRDTEAGDLGTELELTRLEYQQNRAALSFKQEANRLNQLEQAGKLDALGRKGISAARTVNNILAASGRQGAQLTDAILRGKTTFDTKVDNIERRKSNVEKKLSLQTASTQLKKDDLSIGQKGQIQALYDEEVKQAEDTIRQQEDTKERNVLEAEAMSELSIGQTQQRSIQAIGDLTESRALRNDQAYQKAVYTNDKFQDAFNALTAEQNLLADSLQRQLNAFSRQTGTINQKKDFIRENYDVAIVAAQEVHDSALRRYNTTNEAVQMERDRMATQDQIIADQYEASLLSASQAKVASDARIELDREFANLTADKTVLPEPVLAPEPPAPIVYPETVFGDPMEPVDLPVPEKGGSPGVNYAGAIATFSSQLAGAIN